MQKSLSIGKKNSRLLEISTPFNVEESYTNNDIVSLKCGDTTININEYVNVQIEEVNVKYKIRKIIKNSEGSYTLVSYPRNRTTMYLLPSLGLSKSKLFFDSYFINAYLDLDSKHSLNGKFLYLAYRFIRGEKYRKFESHIVSYPNYFKTIDVSPNLVVYAFQIPKEYWNDIDKFKQAKYSEFSDSLKQRIKISNGIESVQYKVVTKDSSYVKELEQFLGLTIPKDNELDSYPDINNEILTDYD